jgi:anti-sigma B factor antagonist
MQIEERVVGDVTILDLKGKMTLGEGDELLKDKINSLVSQGHKKLLLNLTTVSRQGGKLKLLNLTKRIEDLLTITKLITVFEVHETEEEGVKSFA